MGAKVEKKKKKRWDRDELALALYCRVLRGGEGVTKKETLVDTAHHLGRADYDRTPSKVSSMWNHYDRGTRLSGIQEDLLNDLGGDVANLPGLLDAMSKKIRAVAKAVPRKKLAKVKKVKVKKLAKSKNEAQLELPKAPTEKKVEKPERENYPPMWKSKSGKLLQTYSEWVEVGSILGYTNTYLEARAKLIAG